MARKYPDPDVKYLFSVSGGRCAYPRCKCLCVVKETKNDKLAVIGQIAHIVAHSDTGPRGDPNFPEKLRDTYDNWILLCPTHHNLVDKQPNTFSIADLKQWKSDLEAWFQTLIQQALPKVTFIELEIVTRAIVANPKEPTNDLTLINPLQKIRFNKLERVSHLITMGLSVATEVQRFITHNSLYDSTFPEKLTDGFLKEYNNLVQQGITGDGLYISLMEFAFSSIEGREIVHQSAIIAIMAYLFEKCEIFEK